MQAQRNPSAAVQWLGTYHLRNGSKRQVGVGYQKIKADPFIDGHTRRDDDVQATFAGIPGARVPAVLQANAKRDGLSRVAAALDREHASNVDAAPPAGKGRSDDFR